MQNGNNYITTDNLYLLSGVEVFGADGYDTAASTTTQLEYYVGKSDSYRIKQYNGSNYYYWLRLADSDDERSFYNVYDDGFLGWASFNYTGNGVVPAF